MKRKQKTISISIFAAVLMLCTVFLCPAALAQDISAKQFFLSLPQTHLLEEGDEQVYEEYVEEEVPAEEYVDENAEENDENAEDADAQENGENAEDADAQENDENAQDEAVDSNDNEETTAEDETTAEENGEDADSNEKPAASTTSSEGGWPEVPEIDAEAIYLMEPDTGSILNSKNADKQMYPASTTKILTCLIALQTCSLDEIVTFSETAVDLDPGDSNIGAVAGEEMPMRDVLYGLMVASGNECANAIAEHIAGSNEAFAEIMNQKAAEIGAENSHFMNPSGLYHRDHYTTAEDLAKIACEAYKNSTFVNIISHREYAIAPTNMDVNPKRISTTVELIDPNSSSYSEYVIGGKTGYLLEAGRCLVSFAKKDGVSFISVLLNSGYQTVFAESLKNLEYGYNNFTIKNVSELESRFSYMDENCKVYLDPRAEIMTVTSIPFTDLDAHITYVSDMDQETRETIFNEIGMRPDAELRLYAELKYSYEDHYLGKVYVMIDPSKEIKKASFVEVTYINLWYVIAAGVLVVIILIIAAKRPRRRRTR